MSREDVPSEDIDGKELKVRLYELLHRQIENERRWRLVRLGGGFAVIALVLGFAFAFDRLRFVSVTPILFGVVVMAGLRSSIEILYIHRHLIRIERELESEEPLYHWVSEYGTFGDGQALTAADVDLNVIPQTALYMLVVSIYLVLVVLGVATWEPLPAAAILGLPITRTVLAVGYVLFTAAFVAIAVVGYLHFRRLREDVTGV